MTTPLSDADLKQIWARWEKGIETYDDIVAAGDDIPHLLVEVDRLRAEVERLRDMLDRVAASDQAARASDRKRGELLVEALARVARLEGVLREVEWSGDTGDDRWNSCPYCEGHQPDHAPDCALDAALRGANE